MRAKSDRYSFLDVYSTLHKMVWDYPNFESFKETFEEMNDDEKKGVYKDYFQVIQDKLMSLRSLLRVMYSTKDPDIASIENDLFEVKQIENMVMTYGINLPEVDEE